VLLEKLAAKIRATGVLRAWQNVVPKNKVGLSPTGTFAIELGNYKPTHGTDLKP